MIAQPSLPLDCSYPDNQDALSQHFTPQPLADRIVEWAGVSRSDRVLEPSAGSGAFVRPLLKAGARVSAVEVDPRWVEHLRVLENLNLRVHCCDFTAWNPDRVRFDLCLTNPPYENDQDATHVELALSMADRVVALVRANFLHGVNRRRRIWSQCYLRRLVHLSARPHFSGAGSPRHDFSVVEIIPGKSEGLTRVEWWT